MKTLTLALPLCCLALVACGGGAKKPAATNANNKLGARASTAKQSVSAQKPASPTKTAAAPKPLPSPKSAGSTTVTPADPTKSGAEAITFSFTDTDLDGDGDNESGVVLASEDLSTMVLWWSAATDFGDGEVPYDAVLWAEPSSSGFVIDFGGAGSIACAGGACVSCDAEGTCEAQ